MVDAFITATATSLVDDTLKEFCDRFLAQGDAQSAVHTCMAEEEHEGADSQVDTGTTPRQLCRPTDTSLTPHHHVKDRPWQNKDQTTSEDTAEALCDVPDSGKDSNEKEMITHVQIKKAVRFSESVSVAAADDEDDLPDEEEQSFSGAKPKQQQQQPAVLLREMNPEDGTETIISDHTTASAFVFQNSLLFELD